MFSLAETRVPGLKLCEGVSIIFYNLKGGQVTQTTQCQQSKCRFWVKNRAFSQHHFTYSAELKRINTRYRHVVHIFAVWIAQVVTLSQANEDLQLENSVKDTQLSRGMVQVGPLSNFAQEYPAMTRLHQGTSSSLLTGRWNGACSANRPDFTTKHDFVSDFDKPHSTVSTKSVPD